MLKDHDVVIVGGGVQGCAIAQATAAAGFSTLLLEKEQWGSATSSRSSKLIHGGLRYLQTAQFSLVRECLEEREWMFRMLPDLVRANWFYMPIYKNSKIRPWQIYSGLTVYQALGAYSSHSRFRRIPKKQWQQLAGLNTDNLQAVFAYQDGQTDDRQLTRRIQQSAEKLGAECLENTRLSRAARFSDGYQVCYREGDTETCIKASLLINATGPWVNHTLACLTPQVEPQAIDLVQGTHIVLDQRVSEYCFYLQAEDGRAVFVMPWQNTTLVGTTETLFSGNPDDCQPLPEEIAYLTETVRRYFPQLAFEVTESFSGLRVLPKANSRAFLRSRDVQISQQERLINVYGGKLTAWRANAERVLEEVENTLGKRAAIDTRKLPV